MNKIVRYSESKNINRVMHIQKKRINIEKYIKNKYTKVIRAILHYRINMRQRESRREPSLYENTE